MRIAHIDLTSGASGDKLVSALLDIAEQTGCYTLERLNGDLQAIEPALHVERERVVRGGICAWHVTIVDANTGEAADGPSRAHAAAHAHEASHTHGHGHHHHGHEGESDAHAHAHSHGHEHAHGDGTVHAHPHQHDHDGAHAHRHWSDIRAMLEAAPLPEDARAFALDVFGRIAEAEATVHGASIDDVAFHEVGALDSIGDIVGSALIASAINAAGPVAFSATPIALGSGTVHAAHGVLPVPAPATALIVKGLPVEAGLAKGELTTPTGAAIVACLANAFEPLPAMVPTAIGMGAGSKEFPGLPNVLRIMLGEAPGKCTQASSPADPTLGVEDVVLLDCNIDHLSGEAAADACKRILEAGALDVWQEPIAMKKGRLGIRLNVLAAPGAADDLALLTHRLTGTLGLRRTDVERTVAKRSHDAIETGAGLVRFKSMVSCEGDGGEARIWVRPEADDVARIAREQGIPFQDAHEALAAEGRDALR